MSSDGRSRRRELVEEAYDLQVKAGLMASRFPFWIYTTGLLILALSVSVSVVRRQSAAQYGAFGLGSAILAHRTWPTFQSVQFPSCPAPTPSLCGAGGPKIAKCYQH